MSAPEVWIEDVSASSAHEVKSILYGLAIIGFLRFDAVGAALFVRTIEAAMRMPQSLRRWYLSIIAEIVASDSGIGFVIWTARRYVKTPEVMAGILTIGLLGLICDQAIRMAHRRVAAAQGHPISLRLQPKEAAAFDTGADASGILTEAQARGLTIKHIFITHTHWDHIQGFPFFTPIYVPGFEITVYGERGFGKNIESLLCGQMDRDYFPIQREDLRAKINFVFLDDEPVKIGDVTVTQFQDFGREKIYDADQELIPAQDLYVVTLSNGYSFAARGSGRISMRISSSAASRWRWLKASKPAAAGLSCWGSIARRLSRCRVTCQTAAPPGSMQG